MKYIIIALLVVLLHLPMKVSTHLSAAAPIEETNLLRASKDTTLIESSDGKLSNGSGPLFFVGRTRQPENSIRRGLIAFDIASAIPAGSKVTSVKLILYVEHSAAGSQQEARITLHRVLADWGEGKSNTKFGMGDQALEGDATWIHTFYPNRLWSQRGGDYEPSESGAQTVTDEKGGDKGQYIWGSTPQMTADVQGWLDSPNKNFGWLLRGDETKGETAKAFHSREGTDQEGRNLVEAHPLLVVTFIPPTKQKK
jgi:hypothetical protein